MFNRAFTAAIGAAAVLILGASPTFAQTSGNQADPNNPTAPHTEAAGRTPPRPSRQATRRVAPPTPAQAQAAAAALITATGSTCQATEVIVRGQIGVGETVYEAACASGPGLVLIGTTPPQVADCVALASQAEITRAADPAADVGMQCQIEVNKDVVKVMKQYVAEAGLACDVDQGAAVGKNAEDKIVYEVGCVGGDGYRIEQTAAGWKKTSCFAIMSSNATCRYTTPEEHNALLKTWLSSSAASACDVTGSRFMGSNDNGSFYEAKCASGDGVIARFDTAMAVQQIYPCAEAARIGGGCKLTVVAAAAPTTQP